MSKKKISYEEKSYCSGTSHSARGNGNGFRVITHQKNTDGVK